MFRQSMRGLRVLDFTHVVAGPLCTMTLADLGADVVKIEPPAGEIGRRIGPPWRDGQSVIWQSVNRNKRSLTLDLKTPAGRRAARRMARQADVVVESFRPGVMTDLDLGYDTLASPTPHWSTARSPRSARRARPATAPVWTASCRPSPG